MTDEEKKAIEFVKSELQDEKIARNDYQSLSGLYGNLEIEIVLNIIEKQSKEIEELKEKNEYLPSWVNRNYISKDKIKAIIEELQEDIKYSANPLSIDNSKFGIKVLQSLLRKGVKK